MATPRWPVSGSDIAASLRDRRGWLIALAFWAFVYILFTLGRSLRPDLAPEMLSPLRLVVTGVGALIYRLAIAFIDTSEGRRALLLSAVALSIPAALIILLARLVLESQMETARSLVAAHTRWTIIWAGYFAAWVGTYAILTLPQANPVGSLISDDAKEPGPKEPATIWIEHHGRSERVAIESIEWVEAQGNYVRIHFGAGSGLMRASMARMEELLQPAGFRRVHRSALCRPAELGSLVRKPSGAFAGLLKSGTQVPVARRMATTLRRTA